MTIRKQAEQRNLERATQVCSEFADIIREWRLLVPKVAHALRDAEAAQRERDAQLADTYGDDSYHYVAERVCHDLSAAIRKG